MGRPVEKPQFIGGRYDGTPITPPSLGVIAAYVARPDPEAWAAYRANLKGHAVPVTTGAFCDVVWQSRHDPFDKRLHKTETYLRCWDGHWRTPGLPSGKPNSK